MGFGLWAIALKRLVRPASSSFDGEIDVGTDAPTAQAASQQGQYLARIMNQESKRERIETTLAEAKAEGAMEKVEKLQRELSKGANDRATLACADVVNCWHSAKEDAVRLFSSG